MRRLSLAVLFVGFALLAFGLWGLFTPSGRATYPAATGMFPFYSVVAGAACIAVAATARSLRRFRRRGSGIP